MRQASAYLFLHLSEPAAGTSNTMNTHRKTKLALSINYNTNYGLISKAPGGKGSGNYGFDFSFKIENVKYKEKF